MSLKFAAISMIRNECDILELFIKINSRVFDAIYILDHMSSDSSYEIINTLKSAGYPVKYSRLENNHFSQSKIITNLVRQVANLNEFNYIVPLDADEFFTEKPDESIEKFASISQFGLIPWRTFCPISEDYFNSHVPLYELFRARANEPQQYYKVIIGNEYAKSCTVSPGNHFASNYSHSCEPQMLPLYISHVPIRSSQQIINKAILGSHALRLKPDRANGEGFHWDLMAKEIRDKNFRLNYSDVSEMAARYAMPHDSTAETPSLLFDGPRIGLSTDSIDLKDLAEINHLRAFDAFISGVAYIRE